MMNEKLIAALAAAKTPEDVKGVLEAEGCEIVPSAGKSEKPGGGPMEMEIEVSPEGGMDSEPAEDESFKAFSSKALKKNMDKMSAGGADGR